MAAWNDRMTWRDREQRDREFWMKRAPIVRKTPLRSKPKATDPKVVRELRKRSGGMCEICHSSEAVHAHHRLMRSQGGKDTLENLLHVCAWCHHAAHSKPELAYEQGWLLHSWDTP